MTTRSWIRHLFTRPVTRTIRKAPPRCRPALELLESRLAPAAWRAIGPAPILSNLNTGYTALPASGRVTGIAADPQDANTLFIASASGGVWKTSDAGTSWSPLTDQLTDASGKPIPLFMGAIAETRGTGVNEIVYAGTGEANNSVDSGYGVGILVSTDGGATWTLRNDGGAFTGALVAKIAINPADTTGKSLYAAISDSGREVGASVATGIYKSTDGGATWTNTTAAAPNNLSTTVNWSDVAIDPSNHNLFAAAGSFGGEAAAGVYTSTNGGATWTLLGNVPSGTGDGRITLANFNNGTTRELFVSIADPNTNGLLKMLKSTDGGATFTDLTTNVTQVANYLGFQGFYDTTLAIDPANPQYVYAGGQQTFHTNGLIFSGSPIASFDGGITWHDISRDAAGNGPHSDDHAVAFDAAGNLIDGNDGGVFKLTNPTSPTLQRWSSLNTNLQTIQFYGIAVDPRNANVSYGGSQDNGTEKYTGTSAWNAIAGGDGGLTRLDPTNDNILYAEFPFQLQVSTNAGSTFHSITKGIRGVENSFIAPYALDTNGAIYYGTDFLNLSDNQGATWTAIGTPGVNNFNPNDFPIAAVAVAPSNNNVVYVSVFGVPGHTKFYVTRNAQAGGANVTWTEVDRPSGAALMPNGLTVDPTNSATAYAVRAQFSGSSGNHVFKTTNYGATWTDISGNLVDTPVQSVAVSADGAAVYLGTDVGVFSSSDGGTSWARFGTGLPNAQVKDLQVIPSQDLLAAGTYGRGMWVINVPVTATHLAIVRQPTNSIAGKSISPAVTVVVEGAGNNVVTSDNSTVQITVATGPGTLGGTLSAPVVNGVATFGNFVLSTSGSYTLQATDGTLTLATTASFVIFPAFTQLIVNTTSDSLFPGTGLLSLREAIAFANLDSSGISTITFDPIVFATPRTITLTGSQLELGNTSETETIRGPVAGVTVNGGGLSRVFQVDGSVTASLSKMTITGGNGGGLVNRGTATLTNCAVSGNTATNGGGLYNNGTATLTNCTLSGNSALRNGGGLYNSGAATLTNCTVSGNSATTAASSKGGGLFSSKGTTTLTDCTVSANHSSRQGGGLFSSGGTTTLTNCTFSGNSANRSGGGLYDNSGTVTLTDCLVTGNSVTRFGGGLEFFLSHTVTLIRCTVSGNSSGLGSGGVQAVFDGTTTLTNCTVSGNSTSGSGGGARIYLGTGTATLTNCTVSGNSAQGNGGGLDVNGYIGDTTTLTNCTVSGNSAGTNGGGLYNSYGLTTTLNGCTVSGNNAGANGGGLANFGGTTTLTNCTVSGNSAGNGGGVSTNGYAAYYGNLPGTTTLTNCTVSGNAATGNGGGLANDSLSTTTVTGTNVKNNSAVAGGGISNLGTLNVANSTINKNQATSKGAGISTTAGTATITDSVINTNQVISSGTALGGGIDCENSTLSLTNCTVNANQANGATALGGGIYALDSTVTVKQSTVNGNKANGSVLGEGGGIYSYHSVLTLVVSIVRGNHASTAFDDVFNGP